MLAFILFLALGLLLIRPEVAVAESWSEGIQASSRLILLLLQWKYEHDIRMVEDLRTLSNVVFPIFRAPADSQADLATTKFPRIICAGCANQAETNGSGHFFDTDSDADADFLGILRFCCAEDDGKELLRVSGRQALREYPEQALTASILTRINRNLNHEPHEPHEQIRTQSQSLVQNGKDSTVKALTP